MIDLHQAILALNPQIKVVHGEIAYDEEGNQVAYDKAAAEVKAIELETAKQATHESALSKLKALGLTDDEISALKGTL